MFTIEEMNDKLNKIHCIDCLEFIRKVPDNSFDVIVTSPPYNIGNMKSNHIKYGTYDNNNMKEIEYQEWQISFLNECFRILKPSGSMFYNHKVRLKNGVAIHPLEWILKSDFVLKQEITWNMKKSANCDKIRFFPFSERIYWLSKDSKTKITNNLNLSDVWDVVPTSTRKETGHIAVMPEKIVENILSCFDSSCVVFEPFVGSGTTPVVCKKMNFDWVGTELEPEYVAIANKRLEQVQGSLF